jgi:type VI protein secretion system component VasK
LSAAGDPTAVARQSEVVHSAFGTVVAIVFVIGVVGAVVTLFLGGRTWEHYGRDHLLRDDERDRPGAAPPADERDEEIRQMLGARNARRQRRGEPPLDVEAEIERIESLGPE